MTVWGVQFDAFDNVENPESTEEATLQVIETKTKDYPVAAEVARLVMKWRSVNKKENYLSGCVYETAC